MDVWKSDRLWLIFPAIFSLALSLLLGGCGDEERRAGDAAKWLKTYSQTNPPNSEWLATNIAVDDKGRVVMDVLVPDEGQVDLIKSRTHVEQTHIVRMACPPKTAKVWTILTVDQVLWINLLEKSKTGLYGPVASAYCRH